ncbi:hypothetical protein PR003_g23513 [Phytophthora rubi]|uniref:Uncharacterized protein n=1 Tax=Phytophthora rubi TaxID=129364 RepID=A0A6A4CVJ3_9STRA|nr:hypothetical protein PR002_g23115 [Phytophthora rubi]KAE9297361.1 hypothetical protein PR003_g23513 [Phytophthora rubi]
MQTVCQCYRYTGDDDETCGDVSWSDDSRQQLVNSHHYNPYAHYAEDSVQG